MDVAIVAMSESALVSFEVMRRGESDERLA